MSILQLIHAHPGYTFLLVIASLVAGCFALFGVLDYLEKRLRQQPLIHEARARAVEAEACRAQAQASLLEAESRRLDSEIFGHIDKRRTMDKPDLTYHHFCERLRQCTSWDIHAEGLPGDFSDPSRVRLSEAVLYKEWGPGAKPNRPQVAAQVSLLGTFVSAPVWRVPTEEEATHGSRVLSFLRLQSIWSYWYDSIGTMCREMVGKRIEVPGKVILAGEENSRYDKYTLSWEESETPPDREDVLDRLIANLYKGPEKVRLYASTKVLLRETFQYFDGPAAGGTTSSYHIPMSEMKKIFFR